MGLIKELNLANDKVEKELHETLAICQNAGESYDSELHSYLENTLGLGESTTTKKLIEQQKALEIVGMKREVIAEFRTIQKNFGDKAILDYPGLLKLCKAHNLFFGASQLFTGQITPKAVEEAKAFDFIKAKTILYVGERKLEESVIDWSFRPVYGYTLVIMAPITMFNLGTEKKKILICNREIIEHSNGTHYNKRNTCGDRDPVLLLPFKSKDRRIYFIVITNWEF